MTAPIDDLEHDKTIKSYFLSTSKDGQLPTNFSWMVMQKVYGIKLARARQRAVWESTFVVLAMLIVSAVLLAGWAMYVGIESPGFLGKIDIAIPALLTLIGCLLLDAVLGILRRESKQ